MTTWSIWLPHNQTEEGPEKIVLRNSLIKGIDLYKDYAVVVLNDGGSLTVADTSENIIAALKTMQ